jgi:hypothetical protein
MKNQHRYLPIAIPVHFFLKNLNITQQTVDQLKRVEKHELSPI